MVKDVEISTQILADADEIEFTIGCQYPAGSSARAMFSYCAEILRREFLLSDAEKLDLVLKILQSVGPCTKGELAERMDFSRDESRRLIDLGTQLGVIEQYQESTSGRPRSLLRIP